MKRVRNLKTHGAGADARTGVDVLTVAIERLGNSEDT